jgi:hypothetical protein
VTLVVLDSVEETSVTRNHLKVLFFLLLNTYDYYENKIDQSTIEQSVKIKNNISHCACYILEISLLSRDNLPCFYKGVDLYAIFISYSNLGAAVLLIMTNFEK